MLSRFLVTVLGLIGAGTALAQVVPVEDFRRNGSSFAPYWSLADEAPFRCVGRVTGPQCGSGIWLGGPYVLWCGHGSLAPGGEALESPERYTFALDAGGKSHVFRVRGLVVPDGFRRVDPASPQDVLGRGDGVRFAFDLAILELEATPDVPGVEPPAIYDGSGEVGLDAVWVGYGGRGTVTPDGTIRMMGSGFADGRRFAFTNRIERTSHFERVLWSSFGGSDALEGQCWSGSSGGGVFARVGGRWTLIGQSNHGPDAMRRRIAETGSPVGSLSGATRLSPYARILRDGLETGIWDDFARLSTRSLGSR